MNTDERRAYNYLIQVEANFDENLWKQFLKETGPHYKSPNKITEAYLAWKEVKK
jgi:hypothetical protein